LFFPKFNVLCRYGLEEQVKKLVAMTTRSAQRQKAAQAEAAVAAAAAAA
jgi:hypothetical protein